MHKKFEINQTKIKGSCLSGRKVVTDDSKSDLPLVRDWFLIQNEKLSFLNMHYNNIVFLLSNYLGTYLTILKSCYSK